MMTDRSMRRRAVLSGVGVAGAVGLAGCTRNNNRAAVFLTGGELVEFDDTNRIVENPESQRVEEYITGTFG